MYKILHSRDEHSDHIFGWREGVLMIFTYLIALFFSSALAVSEIIKNDVILSLISYVFTFSLCILVFYRYTLKCTGKRLKFNIRTANTYTYVTVFPLMFGGMLVSEYFIDLIPTTGEFFGKLWKHIEYMTEDMLKSPVLMILLTCVFAPVLEEVLFRGILQKGLINKGITPIKAIFLSSFIFAVVHANPWQFVSAFILGIILGWVYNKTMTLLLSIILHAFNNISACVLTLNKKQSFSDIFKINSEYSLIIGILFLVVFGYLFYSAQLRKVSAPK